MGGSDDGAAVVSGDGGGTTRRGVLLGATGLAAATAMATAIGGSTVAAAPATPAAGGLRCVMPGIGEFALTSLQWGAGLGVSSPQGGGTRETSAPSVSEMTVTKQGDATSPLLFGALVAATIIDPVTITTVAGARPGVPAITYVLSSVIVSGFSTGTNGEAVSSDTLSFNFARIEYSFGDATAGYDLAS